MPLRALPAPEYKWYRRSSYQKADLYASRQRHKQRSTLFVFRQVHNNGRSLQIPVTARSDQRPCPDRYINLAAMHNRVHVRDVLLPTAWPWSSLSSGLHFQWDPSQQVRACVSALFQKMTWQGV